MEALWNLEDKWKLSTQKAIIFFATTTSLVVLVFAICAATMFRKRHSSNFQDASTRPWKKGLLGSGCWSRPSKWEGNVKASPLLGAGGGEVGWPSHNAMSPVWQRPILMGEKCEFPRFSGLILYDESGKPLDPTHSSQIHVCTEQPTVRATLRDLL